jgi:hypothetical protein
MGAIAIWQSAILRIGDLQVGWESFERLKGVDDQMMP